MLDEIKLALRIKNNAYDTDIQDLIDACKIDLKNAGVEIIDEADALTKQAIKLYCKANFGYDTNSEKFAQAYESLKISIALSGDYNSYKLTFIVTHLDVLVKDALITIGDISISTNSKGTAIYSSREKGIDIDYKVSYLDINKESSIYLDGNTLVSVVM